MSIFGLSQSETLIEVAAKTGAATSNGIVDSAIRNPRLEGVMLCSKFDVTEEFFSVIGKYLLIKASSSVWSYYIYVRILRMLSTGMQSIAR